MTELKPYRDQSQSVLRYDAHDENGGILHLWGWGTALIAQPLPADLPIWGMQRDLILADTPNAEGMWAGAVSIASTQLASMSWEIEGDAPRLKERTQDMLLNADGGAGWTTYILKSVQDFLCTNNGMVSEIERYGRGPGARIKAIHHLDTLRCIRTGDRDKPIRYRADDGEHDIPWYNLIMLSDMPSPRREHLGAGNCAAQRAYRAITKLAAMEAYIYQKITGSTPLEMHIVTGVGNTQLEDAAVQGQADQAAKAGARSGVAAYKGVIVMTTVQKDATVSGYRIPLASLPDGFNRKEEFDIAMLSFSNCIGMDPQDLQPLTGQSLGSGAQSQVLNEKSRGRGMAGLRQGLIHQYNTLALSSSVKMVFVERSFTDQKSEADIAKTVVDTAAQMVGKVGVRPEVAQQYLVDYDVLPQSALPQGDTTPNPISDTDKPTAEDGLIEDARLEQVAAGLVTKADDDDIEAQLADELDAARRLARQARRQ